jgi:hypothetical protein
MSTLEERVIITGRAYVRLVEAAGTRLAVVIFGVGCFVAVALILWTGMPGAARREPDLARGVGAVALPPYGIVHNRVAAVSVVTCTDTLSTTADVIGGETGNDLDTAAPLAPYFNLSLVGTVDIHQTKPAFDEYFRLDNTAPGASYRIEAVPDFTTNYNLGIVVYDLHRVPILTDTNLVDFKASVTLVATDPGPYYLRVFQASAQCRGGTYDLNLTYTGPTPTPTATPTSTPQPGACPDQYDIPPGANDTITTAAVLGDPSYTGLTLCNLASCNPYVPNDDQDWYVISAVKQHFYTVNAVTNWVYPILNMQVYQPDRVTLVGQVLNSSSPSISWYANVAGNRYVHIWRAEGSLTNGSYNLNWNAATYTHTLIMLPVVFKSFK